MRTFLIASFTLALALIASAAHGQPLRAQALSETEREAVIFTLGLGDDGVERLDELAAAVTEERAAVIDAYQERMRKAYEAMARGDADFDMETVVMGANTAQDELDALQRRLIDDVALAVEGIDPDRVESCRLRLRRMGVLDTFGSEISALTADPLAIAMELDVPARIEGETEERFRLAMLMYDRDVAARLEDFDEIRERAMDFMGPGGAGEGSPAMMEFMEDMLEFVNELRETHTARADAIAEGLPADLREEWDDAWRRAAYPAVYRVHWTERAFERLLESEALTASERDSVEDLRGSYAERLERLRREACRALDDAHDRLTIEDAMGGGTPTSEDAREAEERIEALAEEARARLLTVIDPERHELLPPL